MLIAVAAGVLAAAAAVWALTAGAAPARTGTVEGAIVYSGGPVHARGGDTPRAGHVTAVRGGHVEARVRAHAGRRFRIRLRVGRYQLRATSGDAKCAPKRVRVHRAATVNVKLVCSVR
jgi:hypothetical protein